MKHFLVWIFLFSILLTGCSSASSTPIVDSESQTLLVFAAASLTDAFTEIGENFESQNPNVAVTFNFAGSQALRTQIEEGAPTDVFASASGKEMETLITNAFVIKESSQIFLSNQLIIILPADNPAGINSLEDLAIDGVKIVLAAEEVPVGNYARQALDLMNESFGTDFKDKVLVNVVSNEDNVKQVVAKVQLGEADAGIVYTSDAIAAPELQTIEIPSELNIIAKYPIAPLVESANADLAQAFIAFVLSDEGQAILQKWGFGSPLQ
ncbi:MAG TPA: molybdate ABC transporter substrate-binding protein [Anaerolineae bacterium]|nr:molybdate ABC transporter substrate-binding protein [Anaerolineae bacterium]HRJ75831.1 molybdate ABC transporter substrate-binding protein [Anaerolineales bacterium]